VSAGSWRIVSQGKSPVVALHERVAAVAGEAEPRDVGALERLAPHRLDRVAVEGGDGPDRHRAASGACIAPD
jgi:hypothetical protein